MIFYVFLTLLVKGHVPIATITCCYHSKSMHTLKCGLQCFAVGWPLNSWIHNSCMYQDFCNQSVMSEVSTPKYPLLPACLIHTAPDPNSHHCGWLAHRAASPYCSFVLGLAEPQSRPGHQTLAGKLPSLIWPQVVALFCLFFSKARCCSSF